MLSKANKPAWLRRAPMLGAISMGIATMAVASVAHAAPPPLDAYGELPEIEQVAVSGSGKLFALVGTFGKTRNVIVTDAADKVTLNAEIGIAKVRDLEWAGDDFVLLYTSTTTPLPEGFTTRRIEATSGLILPAAGGTPHRVFATSSLIVGAIMGRYGMRHIDGGWQGYFGALTIKRGNGNFHHLLDNGLGIMAGDHPALFGVDLASDKSRQIAPAGHDDHYRDWLVDAKGQVAAYLDYSELEHAWTIFGSDNKRITSGAAPNGDPELLSLGPDGRSAIYGVSDVNHVTRWYEVPLSGGAAVEFLPGVDAAALYSNGDTGQYLGYREDSPSGALHFLDPAKQAIIDKITKAFPRLNVRIMDWSANFGHIIVRTDGNKDSGTWYDVDVSNLHARAVGYERMKIDPAEVGPISRIQYTAADGLAMDGILTLPPHAAPGKLPLVVLPHGGPHAQDDVAFDWWAQAFASRGYAVFQPNFRGSTGHGQAFMDAGLNEWGRKMQTDISDGVAELARRGIVDPARACIVGASYGGYAALAGVTLQKGVYRCAVAVAPVSDLWQMYHDEDAAAGYSETQWRELKRFLGDPSGYSAVSPARHAEDANAPILLIHGKDDTVVPYSQSTTMANALKNAGKPYEMVTLQGEDHWLSRAETRKQMLTAAMAFVIKYAPPS